MAAAPVEHGDEARAALRDIVAESGLDVLSRPITMSSLVADLLPDAPRLAKLFVMAAEGGVATALREHVAQGMDAATAAGLVASSFAARTMVTPELCNWAVGEFGIVMGLIPADAPPTIPPPPSPEPVPNANAPGPAWPATPPAQAAQAAPAGPAAPVATAALPGSAAPAGQAWPAGPAWPADPTLPKGQAQGWPGAPTIAAGIPASPPQGPGWLPGSPGSPFAGQGGTAGARPARRKLAVVLGAGALVIIVIAGLLIWAPWKSPPVLRPAGLTSGASTISSVAMTWSSPATGPLPDRYLILQGGRAIAVVPGTVTSYEARNLVPATAYHFQVRAVRGGVRSPRSAILTTQTVTPAVSAAVLSGSWTVREKVVTSSSGVAPAYTTGKKFTDSWIFTPGCLSGPLVGSCSMAVSGAINGGAFSATLRRIGATYTGTFRTTKLTNCGTSHTPINSNVRVSLQVSTAAPSGKFWAASAWSGSMHTDNSYTSVGGGSFCSATSWSASLGSP